MKLPVSILIFFIITISCVKQKWTMPDNANQKTFQYLALGDSYTIGEKLPAKENFPHQVSLFMQNDSVYVQPRVIAKTGWTTDELNDGINKADNESPLLNSYDFVSLLIGVNNQYRGRSPENYRTEFQGLLNRAIGFAGNRADRVVVLSIPDWGVTPYADGRNRAQIALEIDAYNAINREIAARYNIYYIDITPWTREAATDPGLLAEDNLHPSAREYRRWAEKVAEFFRTKI